MYRNYLKMAWMMILYEMELFARLEKIFRDF